MSLLAEVPGCNPVCRACHYKHVGYVAQLMRKQQWAEKQLAQWAGVLRPIVAVPVEEQMGYRSKSWMRSSFRDGDLSFGMVRAVNVAGKWEKELVSWNHCPLHIPAIQDTLTRLRGVLAKEAREVVENSLLGIWIGSPHVVIVGRDPMSESLAGIDWGKVLVNPLNRVWFHQASQVGKKVFGAGEIRQIFGAPADSLHPIRAFRQVARTLLQEARGQAIHSLMRESPILVLDLYCGSGDLSLEIPEGTAWLGIEHSKEAVAYANSLRSKKPGEHMAFEGGVAKRLKDPRVLERIRGTYAIFINPPRPGLLEDGRNQVRSLIRKKQPTSVAYLSCSVSSLARDLEMFISEGFEIESLQPYDFFPQTEHFETLALLRKL